jgi:hypothetical protein
MHGAVNQCVAGGSHHLRSQINIPLPIYSAFYPSIICRNTLVTSLGVVPLQTKSTSRPSARVGALLLLLLLLLGRPGWLATERAGLIKANETANEGLVWCSKAD